MSVGKFRGLDTGEGWIRRRFEALERQLRELGAAKRLQASTIGVGGVDVVDGGAIRVYGEDLGFETVVTLDPAGGVSSARADGFEVDVLPSKVQFRSPGQVGTIEFDFGGAGYLTIRSFSPPRIQHATTTSAANCRIITDGVDAGYLALVTSSSEGKQDSRDPDTARDFTLDQVLAMRPRVWRDKAEVEANPDHEHWIPGFIAEELHDAGLNLFVDYDADGTPVGVLYDRLAVALHALAKRQEKNLVDLKLAVKTQGDQIVSLTAAVKKLSGLLGVQVAL